MKSVRAISNGQLTQWGLIIAIATLGAGAILLWYWQRGFVSQVGPDGITLSSGRQVPWNEVESLVTRKSGGGSERQVSRMYVNFVRGRGVIIPGWLINGPELVEAVKEGLRNARPDASSFRAHYVHRL